ncbi:MAG: cytochrome c5 family protein [Neptuniibacter sp.]
MKKITSALVALGLGIALSASVQANTSDEAVVERIKAVGSVCIEGDDSCGGAAPVAAAGGAARSGEEVFNTKCAACHATGAAGAPKYGTADWAERGTKGLDTLLSNAINGFKGMPPRGLCADCSDDEMKASIEYMLNGSK